jgi:hypothetical protein
MKILDVWAESQYKQVMGEEGTYDAHAGYHLIAQTYNEEEKVWEYFMHFHAFRDDKEADKFAERVKEAGEICEKHWDFIKRDVPFEIPYWATTEFAIREKEGTL